MSAIAIAHFVATIQQHRLLSSDQLDAVGASPLKECPDARALARELIQRGWLTPFVVNRLLSEKADELLLGPYVLLDRLGEGGMGAVYKARHQKMNRIVALKVIRRDRLGDPDAVQRFEREVEAAARLAHPNVVTAFDAAQVGDVHYFAMEYVEGTDLAKFVKEKGALPAHTACNYLAQAARGLQHAFERGLIHRDIKPANLVLTADGATVKLLDLGLARLASIDAGPAAAPLTHSGSVVGTPDYLAPEQARNPKTIDIRADLYALGCTLYFLLAGRSPFRGDTLTETLLKHQLEEAPPLEHLRPDVPVPVLEIVRKLMSKRPEDRYATPAELAAALEPLAIPRAGAAATPTVIQTFAPTLPAAVESYPTAAISIAAPVVKKPRVRLTVAVLVLAAGAVGVSLLVGALLIVAVYAKWSRVPAPVAAVPAPPPPPGPPRPAPVDKAKADAHLTRGKELLRAGKFDEAIAEFTQAIKDDPSLAQAYFDRATAYFKKGDLDKALADHEQVTKLRPQDPLPHFNRGTIFQGKNEPETAIAEYGKAIQLAPGYTAALINRGTCYMDLKRYDEAIGDFNTVLRNDPMNAAAYANRGTVHYRRREYDAALDNFNQAIKFNANSANAYYNRSLVHRQKGNQAEAQADLLKAQELDPNIAKGR